mmetsp:Transcript_5012/g.6025  ORF Transcript_5012/g.6025 Transcript_5012/m.6025 type:complete len:153 (-) Transcript_5012:1000-1458(-)
MSELKNPCQGSTTVHDGNQVYPRLEPKENKYASFKKSCVNLPTQRLPLRNLLDSNMQNDADRKDLTSKLRTGSLLQSLVDQNTSAVKDSPKTDTPHEHMKKEEFKNVNKWRYTHIKLENRIAFAVFGGSEHFRSERFAKNRHSTRAYEKRGI